MKLNVEQYDLLLALTAEKGWKEFVKQLPQLTEFLDNEFKATSVSGENLVYYRGKIDGAKELKHMIMFLGKNLRDKETLEEEYEE